MVPDYDAKSRPRAGTFRPSRYRLKEDARQLPKRTAAIEPVCIVRSRPREGKEGHEVAEGVLLTYRVHIMSQKNFSI